MTFHDIEYDIEKFKKPSGAKHQKEVLNGLAWVVVQLLYTISYGPYVGDKVSTFLNASRANLVSSFLWFRRLQ